MARTGSQQKQQEPRGWRWFLAEFAVVAAGVLAALAAEQAAQALNWRADAIEARQALRAEADYNQGALRLLAAQDECVDRRLALLRNWSLGGVSLATADLASTANRPLLFALRSSAWDVAKTGEVAAHIPVSERIKLSRMYDLLANQQTIIEREREAWLQLARYGGDGGLSAEEARDLRADIATARALASSRRINFAALESALRGFGSEPASIPLPKGRTVEDLCGMPR